jgi:hypothetical protein
MISDLLKLAQLLGDLEKLLNFGLELGSKREDKGEDCDCLQPPLAIVANKWKGGR